MVPGHIEILHTSNKPCQKAMTVTFGNFLLVCTYRVYLIPFTLTARKACVQIALNRINYALICIKKRIVYQKGTGLILA